MTYNYTFRFRNNHGKVFQHRKSFKTFENARKAVWTLCKNGTRTGNAISAWQIINKKTGRIEEASGRM